MRPIKIHPIRDCLILALFLGGCSLPESRTAEGVVASDEPRVWVVRSIHNEKQIIAEVYRCADGAAENQPPKPVCVKAPMVEAQ